MKKTKSKKYFQSNKEILQEKLREYYTNLSEDEKCKKINSVNIRNKKMSEQDRERKKRIIC